MSYQPKVLSENVAKSVVELIGSTPLLEVGRLAHAHDLKARVLVKVEYFNPGGSVKDRIALAMIEAAEQAGVLKPGGTLIEPTSGNTGVGLALVAAVKGYKLVLTMPDTMSVERRKLAAAYGAELVLTPGKDGMKGAIAKANELHEATPNSIIPQQFENPANPAIHEATTAEEIWRDTAGAVDIVVGGVGTGGTISGISRVLRARKAGLAAVAVQPAESPILNGGAPGKHGIQGIIPGFVAKNYDASAIDDVISVSTDDAIATSRELAATEGVNTGISSGAALAAALELAARDENAGKTIVAILPDTGERYLSTALYAKDE